MGVTLPDVTGLSVGRAALAYVNAGINIVPFDSDSGNGKECGNLVGGGSQPWYQKVSTDHDQLRYWRAKFGRFQALATSPGAYGCVVLDVDRPNRIPRVWRSLLETVPFVATRPNEHKRRGHYWFTLPANADRLGNRAYPWGEIRCSGGGIVLPPHGDRIVVRSGEPPNLPEIIYTVIAGAGVVGSAVDLEDFLNRHATQTKGRKLKGIETIYQRSLLRTGSRHDAARAALTVGFGEARLGYVSARNVYDAIRSQWEKSPRELQEIARWCASVAESANLDELKLKSDRGTGTDSRVYAKHFTRKTG
jgi:hypothetical protein